MKRESGVNPEQSRCCEQSFFGHHIVLPLTIFREGKCMSGCESEDLPLLFIAIVFRGKPIVHC